MGIVGSAAHTLVAERAFNDKAVKADFSTRDSTFDTLIRLHPVLKENYFLNAKDAEEDPWIVAYQKNVLSAQRLIEGMLPSLIANGWGRIINLGTVGSTSPNSRNPGYYSAKGALATMTVSLAKEVAGTGVRVNLVSPGMILTPEVQAGYMQRGLEQGWGSNWDEIEAHVAKDIPIRRISRREEVAGLVAFLCGPQADAIHGQNIKMEGGQLGLVS